MTNGDANRLHQLNRHAEGLIGRAGAGIPGGQGYPTFPCRKSNQTVIGGAAGDFCGCQSAVSSMRRLGREDQWLCEILVN